MQSIHKLPGLVAAVFLSCAALLSYAEITPFDNVARAGQTDITERLNLETAYAIDPNQRLFLDAAPQSYAMGSGRSGVFRSVGHQPDNTIGTYDFTAPIPQWKTIAIPQIIDPTTLRAPSTIGVIVRSNPEDRPVPVPGAAWLFASGLIGLASIIKGKQRHT